MAEQTPEQQAALNRIQRAYHMGARELDLSELGLTQIPPEIGELNQIEDLSLSHNNLRTLPVEIGNLKNLKKLYLKDNDLREVPEVLFSFEFLEKLSLVDNKIYHDFPKEMAIFKNLKWLAMGNSFYTQTLKKAQGDNQFRKIPDVIWQLTRLEELYITAVGLTEISPKIEQLSNLRELFLTTNSISEFPKEILELKNLTVLQIQNNPLPIPEEIIESKNAKAITNYYFLQADVKKEQIRESKLLIVGQGSVGKTSLVQRLTQNIFNKDQVKTENISIQIWLPYASEQNEINRLKELEFQTKSTGTISTFYSGPFYHDPQSLKINLWDFGGQEIMHATHQFFLTKRSLYLLVLDSRLTQEENRIEYWLKIIQSFGDESPVLVVGNKIDQHPLDIDRTGLQKKYPNIVGFFETSAATGAGIEQLKETIIQRSEYLLYSRSLIPKSWVTVKNQLEKQRNETNFITYDKYLDLCTENEVSDETSQVTLIGFLHDLGVVLHFQDDPRLEALGILNPQWVTNGVYKILNSHTLFQNKGVLTVSMLDEILNLPEYPRGKRLFIVDMMKKFELCYDIESDKTFLVPDLLPKDEPELKFNGVPAFEYAYPVLPSSVITRFIVRMNRKIDDGFVWRTGVVLKIGDNKALVKADIEDRKITIAIDGVEHTRRDALSAIRTHLDDIHNSIKGLNPEKRVPIPEAPNAEAIEYDYLLMLEREGQETHLVKDGTRLVKVNVRQVLSAIESEEQRKTQGTVVNNYYNASDGGIIVGRDLSGNLISGNNNKIIQDSYNKIQSAEIDPELKQTLKLLTEAITTVVQSFPEEKTVKVVKNFERLVEEATQPEPDKQWYSVSVEGLIKAAENLDKLGTPVISLSRKVLSLLMDG